MKVDVVAALKQEKRADIVKCRYLNVGGTTGESSSHSDQQP